MLKKTIKSQNLKTNQRKKTMKYQFNIIFLLFTLFFNISFADDLSNVFFTVEKSLDQNNNIEILVKTSFNLTQYKIQDRELTGYEITGFFLKTEKSIFSNPVEITKTISDHSFIVKGSGIHKISLEEKKKAGAIVWEQFVYIPYPKPKNYQQIAEKYLPIVAYADKTNYFSQRIEDILNFTNNGGIENDPNIQTPKIKIINYTGKNGVYKMGENLIEFMTKKGHLQFVLNFNADPIIPFSGIPTSVSCDATNSGCNKLFLRDSIGDTRPLTVYYTAEEITESLYISYYYIYAFDRKNGTIAIPGGGAHAFDRESFTLIFKKENNIWKPQSAVYGAHLPTQNMEFSGCNQNNFKTCLQGATVLATVNKGKVKLVWKNIPRLGDHPVIYPAEGSHALFPVYGRYLIPKAKILPIPELDELAGNISDKYTFYPSDFELIELDFYTNKKQSALAFSGFWVDGPGEDLNSRFPPFIRSPKFWTDDAVSSFDNCLTTSCSPYFPKKIHGTQDHGAIKGQIINLPGNGIATVTYGGSSYYKTTTDSEGYFTLIAPILSDAHPSLPEGILVTINGENKYFGFNNPSDLMVEGGKTNDLTEDSDGNPRVLDYKSNNFQGTFPTCNGNNINI